MKKFEFTGETKLVLGEDCVDYTPDDIEEADE